MNTTEPGYAPTEYRRILLDGRSFWLEVKQESGRFLFGTEVNADGSPVQPKGADQRDHLLDKGLATWIKPARMNLHYGELEVQEVAS